MKLLDVNDLTLAFGSETNSKKVIDNVSFKLNKGETLGIVGESGSGKSITALSVLNLQPPNASVSGDIYYYEKNKEINLLKLSDKDWLSFRGKNISMIFQEPMTSLNPTMKCGKQVSEILFLHTNLSSDKRRKRVIELFEEVKLPDPQRIYNSYPHEISGGQKQRVMIAMAIALKPAILIADEPTTALDVTVQKAIIDLLKDIQEKYAISIIFISHDLGVIAQIAHQVLVLYNGQVIEKGTVKKILNNPEEAYTRGLIKCRPELSSKGNRLPVLSDFLQRAEYPEQPEKQKVIHKSEQEQIILSVRGLNKSFVSKVNFWGKARYSLKAIQNIQFDVYKGETLGLVGESGCGKTTLGRVITQLIGYNSGEIEYKGKVLKNLTNIELKQFRQKVQIIFQDPYSSLNPKITIGEAIAEPLKVHHLYQATKERKQRVFELLKQVKLTEEDYTKYPHEFSGGQRQRIVIARALALNPEFIICDESVSALDVSVQAEILNLLNDLKRNYQLTYIFISHDLSVVKYMSDRIMVMKDGQLVEINKADEIYHSPASDYTRKLIDSIPELKV
ncbi:MAG: peptide/nickel transport system ATP-binding protein ddpF [Bacteroidales bacterium]|nr:peptide/nickel transport system ATP-binding protein ddpF [Bacteroidales bacterium]